MTIRSWLPSRLITARLRLFWRVYRDPRTPRWAKWTFTAVALLYLVSPIDLVPDFIPVAGLIDDLVVLPLMMWMITRAAPAVVRAEAKRLHEDQPASSPKRELERIKS
ncbi:MAG: YkvA family protein [Phycisphaeraceae bacterium]